MKLRDLCGHPAAFYGVAAAGLILGFLDWRLGYALLLATACLLIGFRRRAPAEYGLEYGLKDISGLDRALFEHTPVAMAVTDLDGTLVDVNPAYCRLTGYRAQDLIGAPQTRHHSLAVAAGDSERERARALQRQMDETGRWVGDVWLRRQNGEAFSLRVTRTVVRDEQHRPQAYLSVSQDVVSSDESQRLMIWQAHHDTLTKLPNGNLFSERLNQLLLDQQANPALASMLSLNLDHFSRVNDSLGYRAGDQVLMEVAHRLALGVRESDTVARTGGDEFSVLLSPVQDDEDVRATAERLRLLVAQPFEVEGRELFVTASVGATLIAADAGDHGELAQRTNAARVHARAEGGNCVALFDPVMNERAQRRLRLDSELRDALKRDQLALYYQPVIDSRSARVAGFEGLLRWQHPELGFISPAEFIPLAEQSGLIVDIGLWVVDQAIAQLRRWHTAGYGGFRLAVNISTRQLRDRTDVERLLRAFEVPEARYLAVEITESLLVADVDLSRNFLAKLRTLGVKVSLDDFGTGFSSLSYLRDYKFDALKIDRSFVQGLNQVSANRELVATIVALGKTMNLTVVAEGVEDNLELECLEALGCHLIQGFYFAPPMPAEDASAYLARGELRKTG